MPPSPPFSDLLEQLRAKGLPLGVREHLAFAELWTRMDGATSAELRVAAGALLGRSREEVRLVVETFDALYGAAEPAAPPQPPPPLPPWRRALLLFRRSILARWLASLALVAIGVLGLWARDQLRPELPALPPMPASGWLPPWPAPQALAPEPFEALPPAPPAPPEPPRSTTWPAAAATLLVAGVGTLLLVQGPRVRAASRRHLERSWKRARAAMPGPTTFELAPLEAPMWFDRRDLEDAATLLARAFTTGGVSQRLDVARTLTTTIGRGGMPTFVFESSTATGSLLVLEDIAPEMAVWRSKVDALLTTLKRQGVRVDRWVFDGTPARVARDHIGERVALDHLVKHLNANGVLVISAGSGLAAETRPAGPDWREALAQWTRRSWVNPVVSPAAWRPALAGLPVNVWPLTGRGVLEAAADLAVDPDGRRRRSARAEGFDGRVLADDVERLKRLVAVAGHPSLDLIEVLRQRFIPDAPEDTVLAVLADAEHGSPGHVRLPAGEVGRLVAAERRENPQRERAIREYVVDLLRRQAPPDGSVAHLRWRLAEASQRAALSELGVGGGEAAAATLRELSAGPIWEEVRETASGLADVVPPEAFGPRTRGGDLVGPTRSAGEVLADVRSRGWVFPRPVELVVAAVAAGVITGGLYRLGVFYGDVIPNVAAAYRVAFSDASATPDVAGTLTVSRAMAGMPGQVQLYRDGQSFRDPLDVPVGAPVEMPLAPADTGHYYQAQARLPSGSHALSDAVWVPPARRLVPVSVDALPWAELRVVDARTGQPAAGDTFTTPVVVNLPEGAYTLQFSHPDYGPATVPLTISPGVTPPEVRVTMPGFDPAATAQQLFRPPAGR
ncbi:MAG: hypothetical protein AB7O28_17780 [Vicinamibacterales bacterium]